MSNMGDDIADLPHEAEIPPLPPKTYQWEDIRRQRLEGGYPWTHLYKEPFDDKRWNETKEHEYEAVIPMDMQKTPPPIVKIIFDKGSNNSQDQECNQNIIKSTDEQCDKNHLYAAPENNDYEDEADFEDEPEEELTAAELQHQLEETYFRQSPTTVFKQDHKYELTKTRSISPSLTDGCSSTHNTDSPSIPHKMQSQAHKLCSRFKTVTKKYTNCSPHIQRKVNDKLSNNDEQKLSQIKPTKKQYKKNKFNFRKHNVKHSSHLKLPSEPDLHSEQFDEYEPCRRFSFRSLTSFTRSRSNSVKEHKYQHSLDSESESKRKFNFHFNTYPRFFNRKQKSGIECTDKNSISNKKNNTKSTPGTPLPQRNHILPCWINKLTDHKHNQKINSNNDIENSEITRPIKKNESNIVQESIFISLHADEKKEEKVENLSIIEGQPISSDDPITSKMKIDNKNFIFISLHEERFPEKLRQEESNLTFTEEELKIERELKKAQTARKFHHMLHRLETNKKLKARQNIKEEKPEPVIITEITVDDEEGFRRSTENLENSIEIPEDEEIIHKTEAESVLPENLAVENDLNVGQLKEQETKLKKSIDLGKKLNWEKFKFGKKAIVSVMPIERNDSKEEVEKEMKVVNEVTTPQIDLPEIKTSSSILPVLSINNGLLINDKNVEVEMELIDDIPETTPKKGELAATPQKKVRTKKLYANVRKDSKELSSTVKETIFKNNSAPEDPNIFSTNFTKISLDEIPTNIEIVEPEHMLGQLKEYAEALETSEKYYPFKVQSTFYSRQNTLARLERPIPPSRPNRKSTLQKKKREMLINEDCKENEYDLDANQNFNTFPLIKPDKPRRKLRKRRTYSNSTNNTENADMKNIDELEDDTINSNIINAKQLSVSFLPLTSNIVGETMNNYNIRETSSMIHLNLNDPPLPPKRKKYPRDDTNQKYNTMPNQKYASNMSSNSFENNMIMSNDGEIEYADDAASIIPDSDSAPKRPNRRRSTAPSFIDEDRTSRGIESLSSEKSSKEDFSFCDLDSKDIHGYAVINKPAMCTPRIENNCHTSQIRPGKSRRFSFFTFPRIRTPINYIPTTTQTLNCRRLPSPSRPPRRSRFHIESTYTNDDITTQTTAVENINFEEEEQLNFNLATVDNDLIEVDDMKNLQTEYIVKKMKTRPLPPPPRPTRKPRDNNKGMQFENCNESLKKKQLVGVNDQSEFISKEDIGDMIKNGSLDDTISKNWHTNECSNLNTRSENSQEIIEVSKDKLNSNNNVLFETNTTSQHILKTNCVVESTMNINSIIEDEDDKLKQNCWNNINNITQNLSKNMTTSEVSNLNVSISNPEISNPRIIKLDESEIKSAPLSIIINDNAQMEELTTSNFVQDSLKSTEIPTSSNFMNQEKYLNPEILKVRDVTPTSDDLRPTKKQITTQQLQISSTINEVDTNEEQNDKITKVMRPNRQKQSLKQNEPSCSSSDNNHPTLAELMCQILQICHSSVGQAIHSLLEQVIPDDREKRNEVQAAIWVITIIVAGCLMLGLQSNEKVIHHHHWDFHFPPPH